MPEAIDLLLPVLWAIGIGAIIALGREQADSHLGKKRRRRDDDPRQLQQPAANEHASPLKPVVNQLIHKGAPP